MDKRISDLSIAGNLNYDILVIEDGKVRRSTLFDLNNYIDSDSLDTISGYTTFEVSSTYMLRITNYDINKEYIISADHDSKIERVDDVLYYTTQATSGYGGFSINGRKINTFVKRRDYDYGRIIYPENNSVNIPNNFTVFIEYIDMKIYQNVLSYQDETNGPYQQPLVRLELSTDPDFINIINIPTIDNDYTVKGLLPATDYYLRLKGIPTQDRFSDYGSSYEQGKSINLSNTVKFRTRETFAPVNLFQSISIEYPNSMSYGEPDASYLESDDYADYNLITVLNMSRNGNYVLMEDRRNIAFSNILIKLYTKVNNSYSLLTTLDTNIKYFEDITGAYSPTISGTFSESRRIVSCNISNDGNTISVLINNYRYKDYTYRLSNYYVYFNKVGNVYVRSTADDLKALYLETSKDCNIIVTKNNHYSNLEDEYINLYDRTLINYNEDSSYHYKTYSYSNQQLTAINTLVLPIDSNTENNVKQSIPVLSNSGNKLIIRMLNNNSNSCLHIYSLISNNWVLEQTLLANNNLGEFNIGKDFLKINDTDDIIIASYREPKYTSDVNYIESDYASVTMSEIRFAIYKKYLGEWSLHQKIKPLSYNPFDGFIAYNYNRYINAEDFTTNDINERNNENIAISSDASIIAIPSVSGSLYIYKKDIADGLWKEITKLYIQQTDVDPNVSNNSRVFLNDSGTTLIKEYFVENINTVIDFFN